MIKMKRLVMRKRLVFYKVTDTTGKIYLSVVRRPLGKRERC